MRTARGLFARLCSREHLELAAQAMVRGKRRSPAVAWFLFRREELLARLADALAAGTWEPEGFDLLLLRDPKPRVIARAPVIDRVVHQAIVSLLEPVFAPSLLPMDYACRAGLGTHRALLALQRAMRAHRFVVHLDIRAYFPSIHLGILRDIIAQRVRDDAMLAVVDRVLSAGAGLIDGPEMRSWLHLSDDWPPRGRGLPIGAHTSQFWAAHVYLLALDYTIKRSLRVPSAVRYVDDIFLFGDSRAALRGWRAAVGAWLGAERDARLKHPNARILSCAGHLDALGCRVTRDEIRRLPVGLRRLWAGLFSCGATAANARIPALAGAILL